MGRNLIVSCDTTFSNPIRLRFGKYSVIAIFVILSFSTIMVSSARLVSILAVSSALAV